MPVNILLDSLIWQVIAEGEAQSIELGTTGRRWANVADVARNPPCLAMLLIESSGHIEPLAGLRTINRNVYHGIGCNIPSRRGQRFYTIGIGSGRTCLLANGRSALLQADHNGGRSAASTCPYQGGLLSDLRHWEGHDTDRQHDLAYAPWLLAQLGLCWTNLQQPDSC